MNASQIQVTYKSVLSYLSLGQMDNAFQQTKLLVQELQMGDYADRLEDLQQNYRYLLQYYLSGVDDPQRKTVYNKLISKLFALNSELREELLFRNSSNFEFTQKRYFPHKKRYSTNNDLLGALNYYHSQSALFKSMEDGNHEVELKRLRTNYEAILPELFNIFWLSSSYRADEKGLFGKIMAADYTGWLEKSLLVSALTLNLWRTFDENKLMLLFDCTQVSDPIVKQRALVGLCFVLAKYNQFLAFFPAVRNRLVLMADDNQTAENFLNIIILIIGSAETDKISRKMQEEILPEMMKISPMLKDKMDTDSLLNTEEWGEENPAWQEMLEQSGISDKLKELTELHLEGADVYMSTFSVLKSFPFFSEFSHWFLPFDTHFLAVNELFKSDQKTVMSSFVKSAVMCNSDKYSFCLSILQMPESQRGMLKQSFQMEAEQLEEMAKEESILTPNLVAKNIAKQYIQDLFRFFKLYPQHSDFSDMFSLSLFMHRSFLVDILSSSNTSIKNNIAEYYFAKNHYVQALQLFEEIQAETKPSAALYQKIGYAYQQTSQLWKALDAYVKADIIQPDDVWTVRKIALCYRLLAKFEKALEQYQHVEFLQPNQPTVLLQIGNCLSELGRYKEALYIYYKLDAENAENIKVWRAIIWCAFVSGDIQKAGYFSTKMLDNEPLAQDFLNAGHIAWCERKLSNAVDLYRKSWKMYDNDWELFLGKFNEDRKYLISNGVDADEISLLLDIILTQEPQSI